VPERFSYQQINELLTAAGHAKHPVVFVAIALHDLASGTPLEDILHNGQFFNLDITNAPDPEEVYNRRKKFLKKTKQNSFERLYNQTIETVTFQRSSNEVVKEWWVQNPPAVYPLPIIRWILLHRNVAQFSQNKFNQPYIPSTVDQREHTHNRTVGVGFMFQDVQSDLKHPYRLAMEGDDACMQAIRPTTGDKYWEHKEEVVIRYLGQSLVFEDSTDMIRWFTGAAPISMEPNEIVQWFQ
jgi:hypothetical protein